MSLHGIWPPPIKNLGYAYAMQHFKCTRKIRKFYWYLEDTLDNGHACSDSALFWTLVLCVYAESLLSRNHSMFFNASWFKTCSSVLFGICRCPVSRGAIFVEHWGDICNFTPILSYFQHWGDEPRPRFFSGEQFKWRPKKKGLHQKRNTFFPNSGEDQKKVFSRNGTLFSSNSSTDLRSDEHQSQIIGGDVDEDHTQIVWGDTVKLLGGYPPHPPGFRHSCL